MKPTCIALTLVLTLPLSGCSEAPNDAPAVEDVTADTPKPSVAANESSNEPFYGDKFPEVLAVEVTPAGEGEWRFAVTLSSAYDSPERYADAWRVLDAGDQQLGVRVLGHDHAAEQPFTRSETISVPGGVTTVFVEGRDEHNGWSGQRFETQIPAP